MKNLIKAIGLMAFLFVGGNTLQAQLGNGWRAGIGAGYMNYYGDITPTLIDEVKRHYKVKNFEDRELALALFLERQTKNGNSLVFNFNSGTITANDRSYAEHYDRSLNFKTDIRDLSATYMFRTDNGSLFKKSALIAPYFFVGVGVTNFTVYGDLKDGSDNFYDYNAEIVDQDEVFETNLSDINVEKNYKQNIMNIPFGLGLKLQTGKNWSVHLQTDVKYMFTDYVDDVSKTYLDSYESNVQAFASRPNGRYKDDYRGKRDGIANDMYAFTSLSLRFNFGKKKRSFVPPIFPPTGNPATIMMENKNGEAPTTKVLGSAGEVKSAETATEAVEATATTTTTGTATGATSTTEAGGLSGSMTREEISAMMEEMMAKQAIEIKEEVIVETAPPVSTPAPQPQVTSGGNGTSGNAAPTNSGFGYDPTVEMYKIETDRLRAENSDLKNEQQFESLKNEINQLKQMMMQQQQMMMGGQPSQSFQQGQGYQVNPNQPQTNGGNGNGNTGNTGSIGGNGWNPDAGQTTQGQNSPYTYQQGNSNNQQANQSGTTQPAMEKSEEEMTKKEKKAAKKAEKKAKKEAEAADGGEEKKGGFMKNILKKDKDEDDSGTVNVEDYQFTFSGESMEVNKQLKSQLKKIAKKANKGKVVLMAKTNKENETKTNTIVLKLAQIMVEDYGLDAGKISYEINTGNTPAGDSNSQTVTLRVFE